eukprot:TRINITY_DN21498_c0_g2_i1.p1 TRINITY_DN21498_c0_g2~~TRINITY_DN21498_c0_g2_i1.p1  ORF type:complete len:722 (-),score=160.87 TRINITY_DN21498_c0_g2_i1:185-2269(-)
MPTPRGGSCNPYPCEQLQQTQDPFAHRRVNQFKLEAPVDVRLDQLRSKIDLHDSWVKQHVMILEETIGSMSKRMDRLLTSGCAPAVLPVAQVVPASLQSSSPVPLAASAEESNGNNIALRDSVEKLRLDLTDLLGAFDLGKQKKDVDVVPKRIQDEKPAIAKEGDVRVSSVPLLAIADEGAAAPEELDAQTLKRKAQFARLERKVNKNGQLSASDCVRIIQQVCPIAPQVEEVDRMLSFLQAPKQLGVHVLDLNTFLRLMDEPPVEAFPLREAFRKEADGEANPAQVRENTTGTVALLLDVVPAAAVALNALVIGISSDVDPTSPVWQVLEFIFTGFFTLECLFKIRLFGLGNFLCGEDRMWNLFDVTCILTAYVDMFVTYILVPFMGTDEPDSGVFMLLKMLRLARLSRLIRLLHFKIFEELKMMVLGVFSGLRVLFWAIVLLFSIVYLLGVVMRKTVGETEEEFNTLVGAMFSVFRCFVDGCAAYNGTPLQEKLRKEYGAVFMILYTLVFLLVTFGLFNLIMAIFIDNVVSAQGEKKRRELGESRDSTRAQMTNIIRRLTGAVPADSNVQEVPAEDDPILQMEVSREVFQQWLDDAEMIAMMEDAGIETSSKYEIYDVLDVDMNGGLKFQEIVDGLLNLRGEVSKADIVAVRMKVRHITKVLELMTPMLEQASGMKAGADAAEFKIEGTKKA